MTKKSTFTLFVFFVCVMTLTVAHAYQISGQAQKEGETDHSGISVTLFDDPQAVPLFGAVGIVVMLILASFLLYHYGLRRASAVTTAFSVLCIVGLAIAAQVGSPVVTGTDGAYRFNGIDPGVYYIQASAAGYETSSDTVVTVSDQNVSASDVTLEGGTAPTNTPVPPTITFTDTPTNSPTNTPTDTPTNTPTDTPTNTPTNTPSNTPTNTPTQTPSDTPTNTPTDTPTDTPTSTPTSTPTDTPTNTPTLAPGDLVNTDTIVGNLRYVPAGTFTQGTSTDPCAGSNETPFTHELTRNIAVMETEISQAMWDALKAEQATLPAHQSYFSGSTLPVEKVTWYEAVLFANLLSIENGLTPCYYRDGSFTTMVTSTNYQNDDHYCNFTANGYRLPTEGEWEYLCRAGTTGPFSVVVSDYTSGTCGSPYCESGEFSALQGVAWYCTNASGTTHTVGDVSKSANPWNLKDVHGNVLEWCWDWYGTYPSGTQTDYAGAGSGSSRVMRGGSWGHFAQDCRSAYRSGNSPVDRAYYYGFRLVRSLP